MKYRCIQALTELSPNARKYVLINKMDKLTAEKIQYFTELKDNYENADIKNSYISNINMGYIII